MKIEHYEFGKIKIDGDEFSHDVILAKDGIKSWMRKESHNVEPSDMEIINQETSKQIIIGNGHSGAMQVPEETIKFIKEKGIELIIQKTTDAVKTYNNSKQENKMGFFHLTC